jgi:hypothetical protein
MKFFVCGVLWSINRKCPCQRLQHHCLLPHNCQWTLQLPSLLDVWQSSSRHAAGISSPSGAWYSFFPEVQVVVSTSVFLAQARFFSPYSTLLQFVECMFTLIRHPFYIIAATSDRSVLFRDSADLRSTCQCTFAFCRHTCLADAGIDVCLFSFFCVRVLHDAQVFKSLIDRITTSSQE